MFDDHLLSRIEDTSLNASAPPQQRWMDGWLLRFNPGKAKRARCVNAVAAGRLPLAEKLAYARRAYQEAELPLWVRVTRFSQPATLDSELAALGFAKFDDTRVMVAHLPIAAATPPSLPSLLSLPASLPASLPPSLPPLLQPLPKGWHWQQLDAPTYAFAVGALRGSTPDQCQAHAQRLALSPVPHRGYGLRRADGEQWLACGQFAQEQDLVGLYDVYIHPEMRRQGLARAVCARLLDMAASQGAKFAYLQVEADNLPAISLYAQLGFVEGYRYHYRQAPD